jgi:hypothetical protein
VRRIAGIATVLALLAGPAFAANVGFDERKIICEVVMSGAGAGSGC